MKCLRGYYVQEYNAVFSECVFCALEIVRFTERGIELLNSAATLPIDCQSTVAVDWQSIEKSDN